MKRIISLSLVCVVTWSCYSQEINFEKNSWSQILEQAKSIQKPIMVVVSSADCESCKTMEKEVFKNINVAEYYNKTFINKSFDGEVGEGIYFIEKYKLMTYPTFYFFDPIGDLVYKIGGNKNAEEFIDIGKDALDTNRQLPGLKRNYETMKSDTNFLRKYFKALILNKEIDDKAIGDFIKIHEEYKTLYNQKNFFVLSFNARYGNTAYQHLLKNREAWMMVMNEKMKYYMYHNLFYSCTGDLSKNKDSVSFKKLCTDIFASAIDMKEQVQLRCQAHFLNKRYSDEEFALIENFMATYPDKFSADDLEKWAYDRNEAAQSEDHMNKALQWAIQSNTMENNYSNADLIARIYFKMSKYSEAKLWAEKSLELAKATKTDKPSTRTLMLEIDRKLNK